jgi:hypothetical protein
MAADEPPASEIQQTAAMSSTRREAERPDGSERPKRRRRPNGESFAATNQLVGLWLPHEMAAELRSRAEFAGLSNSEFVREILRERFSHSRFANCADRLPDEQAAIGQGLLAAAEESGRYGRS